MLLRVLIPITQVSQFCCVVHTAGAEDSWASECTQADPRMFGSQSQVPSRAFESRPLPMECKCKIKQKANTVDYLKTLFWLQFWTPAGWRLVYPPCGRGLSLLWPFRSGQRRLEAPTGGLRKVGVCGGKFSFKTRMAMFTVLVQ